uniref:Vomeronasal type-1 receptor n=1 Tax=Nannospalax galili TaxID=1026970 RepID=A0A8C6RLG8_NANGA
QLFLPRKEEMVLKSVKGIVFLSVTTLGTLGNISVSVNYMFSLWRGSEKKPLHLILIHLAITNIILLSKGLPRSIAAFGLGNFLDDIGCKISVYLERVARALFVCSSSLLTVVRAITISPRASGWRRLRPRSAWHILPFFSFFWILNSLVSMNLIHSIRSNLNTSQLNHDNHCYFMLESQKTKWIVLPLMVIRDTLFQGVMGGYSAYMVFLLHKHHQGVLCLQNSLLTALWFFSILKSVYSEQFCDFRYSRISDTWLCSYQPLVLRHREGLWKLRKLLS